MYWKASIWLTFRTYLVLVDIYRGCKQIIYPPPPVSAVGQPCVSGMFRHVLSWQREEAAVPAVSHIIIKLVSYAQFVSCCGAI